MQHDHLPAIVRVWFADGVEGIVKPLHSTTVPLRPGLAVNLKVEVMSAAPFTGVPILVRVARKSRSAHCIAAISLHPTILPAGSKVVNLKSEGFTRTGAAVQPRVNAWVTVQVKFTTSPGQAACLPSRVELRLLVATGKERLYTSSVVNS